VLPQARDRTFLNRADPRVRGRVTWFPLNGHGRNMGDVGGGDPGPLAKGSSASVAASCTAASMGIAGGAARTFIFKIVNEDQSISYPLFGLGNASAGQDSTLYRSGYNDLTLDGWGGADFSFPAGPSYSSATLTGVITRPAQRHHELLRAVRAARPIERSAQRVGRPDRDRHPGQRALVLLMVASNGRRRQSRLHLQTVLPGHPGRHALEPGRSLGLRAGPGRIVDAAGSPPAEK